MQQLNCSDDRSRRVLTIRKIRLPNHPRADAACTNAARASPAADRWDGYPHSSAQPAAARAHKYVIDVGALFQHNALAAQLCDRTNRRIVLHGDRFGHRGGRFTTDIDEVDAPAWTNTGSISLVVSRSRAFALSPSSNYSPAENSSHETATPYAASRFPSVPLSSTSVPYF